MITNCQQIDLLIRLANTAGNNVLEEVEGWSKVKKVIYMKMPLQSELRQTLLSQMDDLRYRKYQGSPHYSPDEGFVCDKHSIAISFPIK